MKSFRIGAWVEALRDGTSDRAWLAAVLAAGLAIRLCLMPFGSLWRDVAGFRFWGSRLLTEPLSSFYDTDRKVDHLPGDMLILWAALQVFRIFSPEMHLQGAGYLFLLKFVSALADLGIGAVLFLLGRRSGRPGAGRVAACLFIFNPGPIYLTSIWMAWDSVAALPAVTALWLLLGRRPEWSLPMLTFAALVKPPIAALGPIFALAFLRRRILPHARAMNFARAHAPVEPLRRSLLRALLAVVASVVVVLTVSLPFDVGLPPLQTRWSLFERLEYSYDHQDHAWRNTFNVWGLLAVQHPLNEVPRYRSFLLELTYRTWSTLLMIFAYAWILFCFARGGSNRALVWGCLATTFALFMLLTGMHSRYLFPALVFATLAAALAPRLRWLYIALSATYLANLLWTYTPDRLGPTEINLDVLSTSTEFVQAVSLVNLGLLIYVLFRARHDLQAARPDAATLRAGPPPELRGPGAPSPNGPGGGRAQAEPPPHRRRAGSRR